MPETPLQVHPSDEWRLIDPTKSYTGTAAATTYELCRRILVGVTGTYRIYGPDQTSYKDIPLVAGHYLDFLTTKITTVGDAAISDGDVIAFR